MIRAVYLDSSSLLKTLWHEPESPAVLEAIAREDHVVVSTPESHTATPASMVVGLNRQGDFNAMLSAQ